MGDSVVTTQGGDKPSPMRPLADLFEDWLIAYCFGRGIRLSVYTYGHAKSFAGKVRGRSFEFAVIGPGKNMRTYPPSDCPWLLRIFEEEPFGFRALMMENLFDGPPSVRVIRMLVELTQAQFRATEFRYGELLTRPPVRPKPQPWEELPSPAEPIVFPPDSNPVRLSLVALDADTHPRIDQSLMLQLDQLSQMVEDCIEDRLLVVGETVGLRALRQTEEVFGLCSARTAAARFRLARLKALFDAPTKYQEAFGLGLHAANMFELTQGEDDAEAWQCWVWVAEMSRILNQAETGYQAFKHLAQHFDANPKGREATLSKVCFSVGMICRSHGLLAEADETYIKYRDIRRQISHQTTTVVDPTLSKPPL